MEQLVVLDIVIVVFLVMILLVVTVELTIILCTDRTLVVTMTML